MANIFKKLFSKRKSLRQRVEELEKKVEELSKKPIQEEETDSVPFSQIVDEWLNGKEGEDE